MPDYRVDGMAARMTARMTSRAIFFKAWAALCFVSGFSSSSQAQESSQPWLKQSPEEQGLSQMVLDRAAEKVGKIGWRQCFVVIKGGHLVYEHYYVGNAQTPVYAFSLTKSYVSALIGVAVTEGLLSLDERLIDLGVPLASAMHSQTRVRHVLGQVSEGAEPGLAFRYDSGEVVNTLSSVLTSALKRAGHSESLVDYAEHHLFKPLGLTSTQWDAISPNQIRVGYGIRTTGRDAARLGQLFLNQGTWQGQTLIDAAYITQATQPSFPSANGSHGYLWWLNQQAEHWIRPVMTGAGQLIPGAPTDMFMATGMTGNFIYVFPTQDMVVVSLGHTLNWRIESLLTAREIYEAFAEAIGQKG